MCVCEHRYLRKIKQTEILRFFKIFQNDADFLQIRSVTRHVCDVIDTPSASSFTSVNMITALIEGRYRRVKILKFKRRILVMSSSQPQVTSQI